MPKVLNFNKLLTKPSVAKRGFWQRKKKTQASKVFLGQLQAMMRWEQIPIASCK